MPFNLADIYPSFPFARAADAFIERESSHDIGKQLQDRRVKDVRFSRLFHATKLDVTNDGFEIHLNEDFTIERGAESLGYQLGKTFGYNVTQRPPTERIDDSKKGEFEKFCFAFGQKWLEATTCSRVVSWLSEHRCVAV